MLKENDELEYEEVQAMFKSSRRQKRINFLPFSSFKIFIKKVIVLSHETPQGLLKKDFCVILHYSGLELGSIIN